MKIAIAILFCLTGWLQADITSLEVKDPWIRAVPPGSSATAGYFTLINRGTTDLHLTGASSPLAPEIVPMITTTSNVNGQEVHGMEFVKSLVIPAKGQIELKPGGDHLMFFQLVQVPKAGETIPVVLQFGKDEFPVQFPVRKK